MNTPQLSINSLPIPFPPKSSAIHRFSPELLAHVFLDFIDDYVTSGIDHCHHLYRLSNRRDSLHVKTQLVLSSPRSSILLVCKEWHKICIQNPFIWTTILIPFIAEFGQSYKSTILSNLYAAFKNSRSAPLNIHFYALDGHLLECRNSFAFDRVCRMVSSQSYRWKTLSFIQHSFSDIASPLDFTPTDPSRLRQLHMTDIAFSNWTHMTPLVWSACTHVTLIVHALRFIDIPLSQLPALTHLDLNLRDDAVSPSTWVLRNYVDMDGIFQAFSVAQACANLLQLTISLRFDVDTDWSKWIPPQRIVIEGVHIFHPRLRGLILKGYRRSGPHFPDFLPCCVFPCMKHFAMDQPAPSDLSRVFRLWKCDLISLAITPNPSDHFYILPTDILEAIPNVSMLTVTAWGYFRTSDLVLQLCEESILPELTHVKLDIVYPGIAFPHLASKSRDSLIGFELGSSLTLLLRCRPRIKHLAAIITYSSTRIQHLDEVMRGALHDYEVLAFVEDARVVKMRKGFVPSSSKMELRTSTFQLTSVFASVT